MRLLFTATTVILAITRCGVQAATPRGVFAHFMVGNALDLTADDWGHNINLAQDAHIDGFALNMAADWKYNDDALALAFPAAESRGFKLIFSFDYAGGGAWPKSAVINMIKKWGSRSGYWQHDGKPLVSTFEGPGNAENWHEIKAETGCFFMPDWSSLGAGPASRAADGVVDGLFSWAAWPWLTRPMDTYSDHSYKEALVDKAYMMPISPWFFTNLPGYNKNWMWAGGNLWFERWQQALDIKPDYIQIISWNDFGESHHIGPLDNKQYTAFKTGEAPYNYVEGYDHDAWREFLPWLIDTWKGKDPSSTKEIAMISSQITWAKTCHGGGTTGNTASQLQLEVAPEEMSPDRLYIAGLFKAAPDVRVCHGDCETYTDIGTDDWDITPDGGIGMYYVAIDTKAPGKQTIRVSRDDLTSNARSITVGADCPAAANWNAVMDVMVWDYGISFKHKVPLKDRVCIKGWGAGEFNGLCQFTCKYGYCPDSCVCSNMGKKKEEPEPTYQVGYPRNGDDNYAGLCKFACNLGECPALYCVPDPQPKYVPSVSPFAPQACTGGSGSDQYSGLCQYACDVGYCPINKCKCNSQGALNQPVPQTEDIDWKVFKELDDAGLCHFACTRGYCPAPCDALWSRDDDKIWNPNWDLDWVKTYGAVGDSFSAGIGVGNRLSDSDAYRCSRYDGAYPLKIQAQIQAPNFVFTSCSGDTTDDVLKNQLIKLDVFNDYDLITVSAGGNDVGFSTVLVKCLFFPTTDDSCNGALADAETKINTILAPRIGELLNELSDRLGENGIIVWTLYGKFFDEATDPCDGQAWCFTEVLTTLGCNTVNLPLRQEFNRLVGEANSVIATSIGAWNRGKFARKAYPVNWGAHVMEMDGQMCEANMAKNYDQAAAQGLAFYRPDMTPVGDLKRDNVDAEDYGLGGSWVDDKVWRRDTSPFLSDAVLKNFHPNDVGTSVQSMAAIEVIAGTWLELNNIDVGTDACAAS